MEYLPGDNGETVTAVYLVPFHRAEVSLANGLLRLLQAPMERLSAFGAVDWDKAGAWLRATTGSTLAPAQAEAVRLALTEKVRCSGSACLRTGPRRRPRSTASNVSRARAA